MKIGLVFGFGGCHFILVFWYLGFGLYIFPETGISTAIATATDNNTTVSHCHTAVIVIATLLLLTLPLSLPRPPPLLLLMFLPLSLPLPPQSPQHGSQQSPFPGGGGRSVDRFPADFPWYSGVTNRAYSGTRTGSVRSGGWLGGWWVRLVGWLAGCLAG